MVRPLRLRREPEASSNPPKIGPPVEDPEQPARETEMAVRPRESNDRREIVDMGTLQTTRERMRLLFGEEGQDHLALVADKTDEAVRLVGLVALEIGVAHDHHLDRYVADVGVGLRDGQRLHVERDLVEGGRALLDGS